MKWDRFDMSERQLPKKGCSYAFFVALLLMIIVLVVMFVKYKQL